MPLPQELDELLAHIESYKPSSHDVGIVRIMLYGQIGAGKSSNINTFKNALLRTMAHDAYTEAKEGTVTTEVSESNNCGSWRYIFMNLYCW